MQNKTYNIEMTAEDISTVYGFFKMSWCPQDCEITDYPSPLEEKITKIYNEIAAEIKGKVCRTCQHYDEPAGCLCNKHGMRLRSTTSACVSYIPKQDCHPDTPESGQQTIHIKELRRSWWNIGNVGSAHPTRIKRWGKGWMLLLHMYVESDTYILHFSILDYGKKNFCRFSKDEINKLESFMQKCAKEAYEKRHEPPSYEITRK